MYTRPRPTSSHNKFCQYIYTLQLHSQMKVIQIILNLLKYNRSGLAYYILDDEDGDFFEINLPEPYRSKHWIVFNCGLFLDSKF